MKNTGALLCLAALSISLSRLHAAETYSGSTYPNFNNVSYIGYSSTGTSQLDSGTTFTTPSTTFIGANPGGYGTATVTGTGSIWTMTGMLYVANATNSGGTLDIQSGGVVNSNGGVVLAPVLGYTATVNVSAGGAWNTTGTNTSFDVGSYGNGILNITSGGVVTSSNSYGTYIGYSAGATGSVTISGAGSQWNATTGVDMSTGGGTSTLTIEAGGAMTTSGLGTHAGATILVTGSGSVLNVNGSGVNAVFVVNSLTTPTATATVSNGGVIDSNASVVGDLGGTVPGTGSVTVTGANSQWNVTGALTIGHLGSTGTVTVSNGATLSVSTAVSGTGDGVITLGGSPSSSNSNTPASHGTLYIGTGGAPGIINAAQINGFYSPTLVSAVSTVVFSDDATSYFFENASGNGIVISGSTEVVNQEGVNILTAASTYNGGTQVTGGTLLVQNTSGSATGSGTVTVGGAGTLGGNGRISGLVTVESGGSTYPGGAQILTANSLQYLTGSTAQFDLDTTGHSPVAGTDYDQIALTAGSPGALAIFSGATLQLNLTPASLAYLQSQSANPLDYYFLFTLGSGSSEGVFANLTLTEGGNTYTEPIVSGAASFPDLNLVLDVDYNGNASENSLTGGNDVAVFQPAAVPEPSSFSLLYVVAGVASLLRLRRLRRLS